MVPNRPLAMRLVRAVVLTTIAAVAAVSPTATAHQKPKPTEVVKTTAGPVVGTTNKGMDWFLGIPYAQPPVGSLRWRPPVPHARWRSPLKTTAYAGACAQLESAGGFSGAANNEDCLYLNVVAPSNRDKPSNKDKQRPVMVWFYGGGLSGGDAAHYDPTKLVEAGVVFVSINYRLNVFGFFSHPELNNEGHPAGNYGFMDQQLGLQWVKQNIAKFGGDPDNVTIFGESSGAQSVWAHLVAPSSKRLFHKAITESSGPAEMAASLQSFEGRGVTFATRAGCSDAACLRSLSVDQLLAVQAVFSGSTGRSPTIDGTILPRPFNDAISAGQFNKVPIISGANRDEPTWSMANAELRTGHVLTATDYQNEINAFGANAPAVFGLYPLSNYPNPSHAIAAVRSDNGAFVPICGNRKIYKILADQGVKLYAYEFADRTAGAAVRPVSFSTLAAHTAEIQFLFQGFHGSSAPIYTLTPAQEKLSRQMVDYWTTFAWKGSPNSHENPFWAPYNPRMDNYQLLDLSKPKPIAPFGPRHNCDFWESITG